MKQATTKCAAFLDEAERIGLASIQKRMHSYNNRNISANTSELVALVIESRSYTFPRDTSLAPYQTNFELHFLSFAALFQPGMELLACYGVLSNSPEDNFSPRDSCLATAAG